MMTILSKSDVKKMAKSGHLAASTLKHVASFIQPGTTTLEIDKICHDFMVSHHAIPATLNYRGYPKSCCTSVNSVICHGVPDSTVLKEGDIVNVDVTTILDGFHGDTSRTFYVGEVSTEAKKLTEVAEGAMYKGIEAISPNGTVGDIGFAINKYVTRKGFFPVKMLGGHGIGRQFHEEPFVPSFGRKGQGAALIPYHCITVEPMVNLTDAAIKQHPIPGSQHMWFEAEDKSLSAQFEHTILVTDSGYEILTVC